MTLIAFTTCICTPILKDDKRSRSMCWKISINHQFRFFISVCNCLIFSPSHNDIYDDKIKPYKVVQRARFFCTSKNYKPIICVTKNVYRKKWYVEWMKISKNETLIGTNDMKFDISLKRKKPRKIFKYKIFSLYDARVEVCCRANLR